MGRQRVLRLTIQIDADSDRGVERNVATVSAANLKRVRSASPGVRVKPLPDNRLWLGLFRPPGIALRC